MNHLEALANTLVDEGVHLAFGVTGGGPSLQLIDALIDRGVIYVGVGHEAAAALMAGGACRSGQTRAVAIGIKGPGFANFYPGIVANAYENRPALVITEYFPPNSPLSRRHKRLNHELAAREVLRAESGCDLEAQAARQVLAHCRNEAPGPGLLQIGPAPVTPTQQPTLSEPLSLGNYERLLDRIQRAQRPALILGSLCARVLPPRSFDSLTIPIATTAAAKGVFSEFSPYSAGVVTGEVKPLSPEAAVLAHADLLIGVGLRNTEVVLANPYGVPLLSLDQTDDIGTPFRLGFEPEQEVVHPSLKTALPQLLQALAPYNWGEEPIAQHRNALKAQFGSAWAPPAAFRLLEAPNQTLVLDTGYFCTVGETVWRADQPAAFCGSSNGRYMGTAIPTAIGIALAERCRPVICVCGDGGIRPYFPEIRLAQELQLPILFVLMSDGLYGSIAHGGAAKGYAAAPWTIQQPSWLAAAEAFGLPAWHVADLQSLAYLSLIARSAALNGPAFLELSFDPAVYLESARHLR